MHDMLICMMRLDCIKPFLRSEVESMAIHAAQDGDEELLKVLRQFANYKHWLDW